MKLEDIQKVGVIGAGTMGRTVAAATAIKYETVVKEKNKELADKGLRGILDCLPALVRRSIIGEVEREISASRITMTTDYEPFKDCQIIIDCAFPDEIPFKTGILSEVNKVCPPDTIFTTTSSLMSVTALAAGCGRPDKMVGTHYNNPAHLMALVEVAPPLQASEESVNLVMEFLSKGLGKTPIRCKDWPGFIVNYLFFPWLISAINAYQLGVGSIEEIDTACKLGLGHAMGPFEGMDMFGVDILPFGFRTMQERTGDNRFACPPLVVKMAEAGYWGRKTGRGFYKYDERGKKLGPAL